MFIVKTIFLTYIFTIWSTYFYSKHTVRQRDAALVPVSKCTQCTILTELKYVPADKYTIYILCVYPPPPRTLFKSIAIAGIISVIIMYSFSYKAIVVNMCVSMISISVHVETVPEVSW